MSSKVKKKVNKEEEMRQEQLKKQANIARIIIEVVILTIAVIVGFTLAKNFHKSGDDNESSQSALYAVNSQAISDDLFIESNLTL